jgi:crotonobetainyl-CoA:carnitine CoA-transferase CaiB-like acyl-CoA transferase
VIKIERGEGETARHYDKTVLGTSAYFAWLNRSKESVVLDIKDAEDIALLRRMLARADVFVQNLAPGATERRGLGAADLLKDYPRLIAVDIVGYSQQSSYREMRAYDMLIQAESGICAVTGSPKEPVKVGVSMADLCAGMTAHAAVLEALLERSLTGNGKAIEIAMFDVMAEFMSVPLLHHDYGHRDTPRVGLSHAAIYPYGRVACRDGDIIVAVQNPGEWRRFCEGVLLRPDLVEDSRYFDNPSRVANRQELDAIMGDVFGGLTKQEVVDRLETNSLAWSNVSSVAELSTHPALRRIAVPTPGGTIQGVASPLRSLQPGLVPTLGEHSTAVRREFSS